MPRLTAASTRERRSRIVDAAVRCLFRDGLAATSVDHVCAEAGISKGGFYSHFASKDALLQTVIALRSAERGAVDGSSVAALADSIYDRRIAPLTGSADGRFGLETMAAGASDEAMRGSIVADLEAERDGIEQAVAALVARGAARPECDPRAVATILHCFVLGSVARHAVRCGDGAPETRAGVRLLVDALVGPPRE